MRKPTNDFASSFAVADRSKCRYQCSRRFAAHFLPWRCVTQPLLFLINSWAGFSSREHRRPRTSTRNACFDSGCYLWSRASIQIPSAGQQTLQIVTVDLLLLRKNLTFFLMCLCSVSQFVCAPSDGRFLPPDLAKV